MARRNSALYLIFIAAFLVMHFTGVLAMNMPYIINAVIVFTAVSVTVLLSAKWLTGKSFKETLHDTGFRKTGLKNSIPGIAVSAALLCMYPLLAHLLNIKISMAENWQLNAVGLLLTGGLAEEMLFRGFLFRGLRGKMSFRKAVLVSAIVFTMAHLLLFVYFSWPVAMLSTLLAAGLSLPFAYLFEQGENTLWSPACVHAAIRTVGMVFTTKEEDFPRLSLAWIILSLIIPYMVLLFSKSFRKIVTPGKDYRGTEQPGFKE